MTASIALRLSMHCRRSQHGSITVLTAISLYAIVLLGLITWAAIQEGADHTLLARLVADAAYDASHHLADQAMVDGSATLTCLDPSCAAVTCPLALTQDPSGATAAGQACLTLHDVLEHTYTGTDPRLDVTATLAATQIWTLASGAHDPEDPTRVYHYPTVCVSMDAAIGVIAHGGLTFHHHLYTCAQAVYR